MHRKVCEHDFMTTPFSVLYDQPAFSDILLELHSTGFIGKNYIFIWIKSNVQLL